MGVVTNILKKMATGGVSTTLDSAGNFMTKARSALTGEMAPELRAELEKLILSTQDAINNAQNKINEIYAQSGSLFMSGWRPALAWTCVIGVDMQFILFPLIDAIVPGWTRPDIPIQDMIAMLTMLLGLGGYRTYEKKVGVQDKH